MAEDQKIDLDNEMARSKLADISDHYAMHLINFTKQLTDGKKRVVRFSPHLLRIALILYNCTPAGYNEFKQSSLEVYPSISLLKKLKSNINCKDGCSPKIFVIS